MGEHRRNRVLILIGLFRLFKSAFLVAIGVGALHLLKPDASDQLRNWLDAFPLASENRSVERMLSLLTRMPDRRLEEFAAGAFCYAALFVAEGIGLIMQKVWAEYLTILATLSFIPFEIYELLHRHSPVTLAVLVLNVAIGVYLIVLRVHAHRDRRNERA